jgi:hypothetical protein
MAPGPSGAPYAAQPTVYAVPSINLVGAGQIGAAISAIFSLLPCLAFAWLVSALVSGVRWMLDSWTGASLRIPIPIASIDVPVNYIDLFRLRWVYDRVIFWDDQLWLAFILAFLIPWAIFIIAGALFVGLLALIYNAVSKTSGGMRMTLVSTQLPPGGHAGPPVAWSPGPPPGQPQGWPNQNWPPDQRR